MALWWLKSGTTWYCMSFKIIPLSMGFDAWKLSDFHQQQDNLSALKECSAFLGNHCTFCLHEDMRNRVPAFRFGPCTLVQRRSKWFILAKEIQPKCGSWPRTHAAVTAIHSHCGFPRKSGLATVSKCVMRSPSVWNGFKTGGICLSKPKQYYFFSKTEQTCSWGCHILGICSFETSISGHGIGDWNLGTCGQRKERRGAVRMCWKPKNCFGFCWLNSRMQMQQSNTSCCFSKRIRFAHFEVVWFFSSYYIVHELGSSQSSWHGVPSIKLLKDCCSNLWRIMRLKRSCQRKHHFLRKWNNHVRYSA